MWRFSNAFEQLVGVLRNEMTWTRELPWTLTNHSSILLLVDGLVHTCAPAFLVSCYPAPKARALRLQSKILFRLGEVDPVFRATLQTKPLLHQAHACNSCCTTSPPTTLHDISARLCFGWKKLYC